MAIKKAKSVKKSSKREVIKTPLSKSKHSKKAKKAKVTLKKKPAKKTLGKKSAIKKSNVKASSKKAIAKSKVILKKSPIKKSIKKAVKTKIIKKIAVKKISPKKVESKKITADSSKNSKKITKPSPKIKLKKSQVKKEEVKLIDSSKKIKAGLKTKKLTAVPLPQPLIAVSNFPKHKVKTLLISQPKPENDKNPYYDLSKKYNLIETFRQFIKIEGIPAKDFRTQRIDVAEHKAVILTSRMAVDHYFRMYNELRLTVPESMKYFCINEATAYYLQKYIQYRKRKIFFGHQTIQDLVDVIRKNKEEKFLLPAADVHKEQICDFLDAIDIKYTKAIMYKTVSADLSDIKNLNEFDVLAFFTPAGINSLKQNFPNFKQGNTRIACFGATTANTLKEHGYRLDIYAPNPKNSSMSGALDDYIKEANKR